MLVRFLSTIRVAMLALAWASVTWSEEALVVDTETSRVFVFVEKTGFGHQHGVVGMVESGDLALDAKSDAGQIVFDMTSFLADTPEARKFVGLEGETDEETQKKVNENMLGPSVLNVREFPTATFRIDSALPTGKKTKKGAPLYELNGTFSLHGVEKPLSVIAEVSQTRQGTHVRGRFKVLQSKFGMKPYTAALGAVGVADELVIFGEFDLRPSSKE